MALQIQNTGSSQVIISELANFTIAPLTTVNAPIGYAEAQIVSAISPFDTLVLLGATVDLSIPIPRDAEQLTPQAFKNTVSEMNEAVQTIQTEVVSLQEVIDILSQDIENIESGDIGGIILGTQDAFGRYQIWNKLANGVIRLGSLSGDGDPTDVTSEGIVSYGQNLNSSPMTGSDFSYARVKPYRFGLYDSINGGYAGYIFEFDTHKNVWYIADNSGNQLFQFDRTTGSFKCTSITDGTTSINVPNIVVKNGINGSFTTVDGKTITVVDGQITSIV